MSRAGIIYLSEVELDWEAPHGVGPKPRTAGFDSPKEKWLGKCDPIDRGRFSFLQRRRPN